eukprot:GHVU01073821.1.p3 GENE.GHVU01073821.1~~GHVU01073821.1.p3  ORF type:complete len:137 (-),score=15.21 GHVU01073821.1:507-917(-)
MKSGSATWEAVRRHHGAAAGAEPGIRSSTGGTGGSRRCGRNGNAASTTGVAPVAWAVRIVSRACSVAVASAAAIKAADDASAALNVIQALLTDSIITGSSTSRVDGGILDGTHAAAASTCGSRRSHCRVMGHAGGV